MTRSRRQAGGEIGATYSVSLDVTNAAGVARAAGGANEALGRIDILVASAGITGATAPAHEFPVDRWLMTIDVNLNGVFRKAAFDARFHCRPNP
jgi:2-dehydro-3-deoxy-L-rhamnonate dehydrogenase (NAD+)